MKMMILKKQPLFLLILICHSDHKRSASSTSRDSYLQATEGSSTDPGDTRNQVVAVGTPLTSVVGGQQGPVMVRCKRCDIIPFSIIQQDGRARSTSVYQNPSLVVVLAFKATAHCTGFIGSMTGWNRTQNRGLVAYSS